MNYISNKEIITPNTKKTYEIDSRTLNRILTLDENIGEAIALYTFLVHTASWQGQRTVWANRGCSTAILCYSETKHERNGGQIMKKSGNNPYNHASRRITSYN
ncbi:MAG: hypothetical protein HRT89_13585 [Lentisphaeria bacterium]|nr:hypothetical protein [Lentisphaeria bacterium]